MIWYIVVSLVLVLLVLLVFLLVNYGHDVERYLFPNRFRKIMTEQGVRRVRTNVLRAGNCAQDMMNGEEEDVFCDMERGTEIVERDGAEKEVRLICVLVQLEKIPMGKLPDYVRRNTHSRRLRHIEGHAMIGARMDPDEQDDVERMFQEDVFDSYVLTIEVEDEKEARKHGISRPFRFSTDKYRYMWNEIPQFTRVLATFERRQEGFGEFEEYKLMDVELMQDEETQEFEKSKKRY